VPSQGRATSWTTGPRCCVSVCVGVCASAAAVALRVWSIAPSSPLRDPGNPARAPDAPSLARALSLSPFTVHTRSRKRLGWRAAPEAHGILPPSRFAVAARLRRLQFLPLLGTVADVPSTFPRRDPRSRSTLELLHVSRQLPQCADDDSRSTSTRTIDSLAQRTDI